MKKNYVLGLTLLSFMIALTMIACNKEEVAPEKQMDFSDSSVEEVVSDDTVSKTDESNMQEPTTEVVAENIQTTGEDAAVETADDLAYLQQLAEENGTEMPNVTITMYALKNCSIRMEASEESAKIGSLKKGDPVQVSKVGHWNTVVLDDGKEGFVRADLLGHAPTTETADSSADNVSESVDSSANSAGNNGGGSNNGNGNSNSNVSEEVADSDNGVSVENNQPQKNTETDQTEGEYQKPSNNSGGYTAEQTEALKKLLEEAGGYTNVDTGSTEDMYAPTIDPNAATDAGIDISNVTVH